MIEDERVTGALAEGRQAHIAVASSTGPHVTPELYAWVDGRLWFFAAAKTVKAKVLQRTGRAAAVVRTPQRAIVLRGPVEVMDPRRLGFLRAAAGPLGVGAAVGSFALRNASDLAAFAVDAARGRTGSRLPGVRVGFALTPEDVTLIEPLPSGDGAAAVLAWSLHDGDDVLAVPAQWDQDSWTARVPAGLLEGPDTAEASVVLDEYVGPGPAAKKGLLLRGEGRRSTEGSGESAGEGTVEVVRFDADRVSYWDGVETGTATA